MSCIGSTWGRTPGVCSLGWVKSDQTLKGSSSTKSLLIAKRGTYRGRGRINLSKFLIPFILIHSNWSGQIDSQSQSMVKGRLFATEQKFWILLQNRNSGFFLETSSWIKMRQNFEICVIFGFWREISKYYTYTPRVYSYTYMPRVFPAKKSVMSES